MRRVEGQGVEEGKGLKGGGGGGTKESKEGMKMLI